MIAAIKAKEIVTLREHQEVEAALDADHLHVAWPGRHAFDQHAAEQIARLVCIHLEAENFLRAVCTENLIRVADVMESPKLAE